MILLNSLKGETFYLNSDLIYKIEEIPDTMITLVDGKKIRVMDSSQDIVEKVIKFKKAIYQGFMEVN